MLTGVKTFGAPVVKLELEQSTQSGSQSVSQIATNQPIQNPILSSFSRDANKASVNADITAAFLGAGIPLEKLDHPSMKGFLKKYSTVHGTIRDAHTLRKDQNVEKVVREHLLAIKEKLGINEVGGLFYVSFDEWLDNAGNQVCAITLGRGSLRYVIDVVFLECRGANKGVEHKELIKVVNDALSIVGIRFASTCMSCFWQCSLLPQV